jgi:hypothetical protein
VPAEVRTLLEDDNAADLALYEHALAKGAPCTRVAGEHGDASICAS